MIYKNGGEVDGLRDPVKCVPDLEDSLDAYNPSPRIHNDHNPYDR